MRPIREDHPIRHMFAGLVENTFFEEVGVCEPRLTDYLSDLMVNYIHIDRFKVIRHVLDKNPDQAAPILRMLWTDDEPPEDKRERDLFRHIGDFALFWTGIFPEHLKNRRGRGDLLNRYVQQGKRSYAQAARLTDADDEPPPALFSSLSEEFEVCVHGLGLVRRRCWECRPASGAGGVGEIVL